MQIPLLVALTPGCNTIGSAIKQWVKNSSCIGDFAKGRLVDYYSQLSTKRKINRCDSQACLGLGDMLSRLLQDQWWFLLEGIARRLTPPIVKPERGCRLG